MPCPQSCVKMCFRKEDTPFLLKPSPKHLPSVTPCIAARFAAPTLAPQAVTLQQTIFFLVIISQVFLTPAKFLRPRIACWCKE